MDGPRVSRRQARPGTDDFQVPSVEAGSRAVTTRWDGASQDTVDAGGLWKLSQGWRCQLPPSFSLGLTPNPRGQWWALWPECIYPAAKPCYSLQPLGVG